MKSIRNNTGDWLKGHSISQPLLEILVAIESRALLDSQVFEFKDGDIWTWQQLRDYAIAMDAGRELVIDKLIKDLKANHEVH